MAVDVDALEGILAEVIRPNATVVDRSGSFPRAGIDALARAGLLGLLPLADAAVVIERVSAVCGSTAMVTLMHYAGTAVLALHGSDEVRKAIAEGQHLTTLAFSERGSRSHFWAPGSTATLDHGRVRLDAQKSWVTSGAHANSYVWSSKPLSAEGPMTLWLVPAGVPGLDTTGSFDGLGLRGNGSIPIKADGVRIDPSAQLGGDGAGLEIALSAALPTFLVLSTAFALGLMEAVAAETAAHLVSARLEHLGITLIQQPLARTDLRAHEAHHRQHARLPGRYPRCRRGGARRLRAARARVEGDCRRGLDRSYRPRDEVVWRCRVSQGARHRAAVPGRACGSHHGSHHGCAARLRRTGGDRPPFAG
jgi:alkylation response protein AidB-like acyl-CoA dehydrogenase